MDDYVSRQINDFSEILYNALHCGVEIHISCGIVKYVKVNDYWENGENIPIFVGDSAMQETVKYILEQNKRHVKKIVYKDYIKSAEWRARAKAAKERAGWRCQLCNAEGMLHAHHRTYERLGNEEPEDITCLCERCHAKSHDKEIE